MGVYSGNRTLLSESTYNADEPSHIMDLVIECERNDLRMFEAVINCDFIEAYSEAGIISISEEQKEDAKNKTGEGIGKKIKELFNKAIEAIKNFVAKWVAKIKNLFANDAALFKKYKDNFDKNAKGYKVKGWMALAEKDPTKSNSFNDARADLENEFSQALSEISRASDNDAISKELSRIKEYVKKYNFTTNTLKLFFSGYGVEVSKDERENGHPLTDSEVEIIKNVVQQSTRAIDKIKREGNSAIALIRSYEKNTKFDMKSKENSDIELARLNGKYSLFKMEVSANSKILNAVVNAYGRFLAQCRKAFVLAGKSGSSAEEQKKDEAVNASYDFMLGEASDIYVESVLFND